MFILGAVVLETTAVGVVYQSKVVPAGAVT